MLLKLKLFSLIVSVVGVLPVGISIEELELAIVNSRLTPLLVGAARIDDFSTSILTLSRGQLFGWLTWCLSAHDERKIIGELKL